MAANNTTWLRVALALLAVLAVFSVGVTSYAVRTAVANNARIAVVEANQIYMQRQLDRMETKLDIILAAPLAAGRVQTLREQIEQGGK